MAQNKITGRASRGRRGVARHSSFRTERGSASIALEPRSAPTTALPQEMTAGRAIVEVLKAEGVKAVYGIPGGHVLPIYDGLYDTPEISHFLVRHEQAAASMAAAYAQLTGEAAVCLVTAGPGATNLVTNVAEAFVGALPMVILAGRGATATTFRGASQEVDTELVFRPDHEMGGADRSRRSHSGCAARSLRGGAQRQTWSGLSRSAARYFVGEDQIRALRACRTARAPTRRAGADPCRSRASAQAKQPLIVAGGGTIASGASADLQSLAETLAAPVITTLAGRGAIDDDHPLSVGGLGAHRNPLSKRLARRGRCDPVAWRALRGDGNQLAARICPIAGRARNPGRYRRGRDRPQRAGASCRDRRHPGRLGRDARRVGEARPARGCRRPAHGATKGYAAELKRLDGEIAELAASREKPIHPLRVIRAVRQALPREATIAIDVGCLAQHMAGSLPAFPVHLPRSLIVPSSFYGMGFAGSALPVARQVYPDRPAVGFIGDGSFQMMLHVLPMAAEYRLGVTWCVLNDRALGSIRDIQEFGMGNRIIDTDFGVQPDFAKIADACNCYGEQITDPDDVDGAIARALAANEKGIPAVWISSSHVRACSRPTNITLFMDEASSAPRRPRAREEPMK